MKLGQLKEAKYGGHVKYDDPVKTIAAALKDAILTRTPGDVMDNRSSGAGEWFILNGRGGVAWNWRQREYPARKIAEELGFDIQELKRKHGWHFLSYLTDKVLNSVQIKKVKQEVKRKASGSGELRSKFEEKIKRTNQEIKRLTAQRRKIQKQLDNLDE